MLCCVCFKERASLALLNNRYTWNPGFHGSNPTYHTGKRADRPDCGQKVSSQPSWGHVRETRGVSDSITRAGSGATFKGMKPLKLQNKPFVIFILFQWESSYFPFQTTARTKEMNEMLNEITQRKCQVLNTLLDMLHYHLKKDRLSFLIWWKKKNSKWFHMDFNTLNQPMEKVPLNYGFSSL